MSNGLTQFGKNNLLNLLTNKNYPTENVSEILPKPQFIRNGKNSFYEKLIAEFPDLEIIDLLANNDKFLGYGNYTKNGSKQGLIFIINDNLEIQKLNYLDAEGNSKKTYWIDSYDFEGKEILLPIFKKMKIDRNGYFYGIVERPNLNKEENSEYDRFYNLVKFNDFLSTWYNEIELFLIADILVSKPVEISNSITIDNSFILNAKKMDISQNETDENYYEIVFTSNKPIESDPDLYKCTINVININNGQFKICGDLELQNHFYGDDFIFTQDIAIKGKFNSESKFEASILITNNEWTTDQYSTWTTKITNNQETIKGDIFIGSTGLNPENTVYKEIKGMVDAKNKIVNAFGFYEIKEIKLISGGTYSFKGWNNAADVKNVNFDNDGNYYQNWDTFGILKVRFFSTYNRVAQTYFSQVNYGNNTKSFASYQNDGLALDFEISGSSVFEIKWTKKSQNGAFIIKVNEKENENYNVIGSVKQGLTDIKKSLTPQLINSSTAYISIQNKNEESYGIWKFITDTNSEEITDPILLNSNNNFINSAPIYIDAIKNEDSQDSTIIGVNNENNQNYIGLNLYKQSNEINPNQISFCEKTFENEIDFDFKFCKGLRQQNKIFIYGFSENFENFFLFINEYSNGTPNSKPYFFEPYSNLNTNFLLSRIQSLDTKEFKDFAEVVADINIVDSASVNNNFLIQGILKQYTMNYQKNNLWYIISQSNNSIFFTDSEISKDLMEEKQLTFNVILNYYNETDKIINNEFSINLTNLYVSNEITTEILQKIFIKTIRLTFKNGLVKEMDLPWKIDLENSEANVKMIFDFSNSENDLINISYLTENGKVHWSKDLTEKNADKFIKINSKIYFLEEGINNG